MASPHRHRIYPGVEVKHWGVEADDSGIALISSPLFLKKRTKFLRLQETITQAKKSHSFKHEHWLVYKKKMIRRKMSLILSVWIYLYILHLNIYMHV